MNTRRLFLLFAGMALLFASVPIQAQDDSYASVRFTNESDKSVKLKVWNPRVGGASFEATVEIGKSVDLTTKDGKPMRVGVYSSKIQVDEMEPKSVVSVATRQDTVYVVVWTKDGFKPKAKE